MAAHNHLQFQGIWCLLLNSPGSAFMCFTGIHADETPIHIKFLNIQNRQFTKLDFGVIVIFGLSWTPFLG